VLVAAGPAGRSVAVGRDADGALWVYSVSSGQAAGKVDGFACVLPYPGAGTEDLGQPRYVIAGLTEPEDPCVNVFIDDGHDAPQCRVHAQVWVSAPRELRIGTSPSLSWRDQTGTELRRFTLPPLTADMFAPSYATYAPLPD